VFFKRQDVMLCGQRAFCVFSGWPAQVWYNAERSRKPQTFAAAEPPADPTDGGRACDFCNWREMTAEDTFGRCPTPAADSKHRALFPLHQESAVGQRLV
jgi:hypothetical protein